MCVVVCKKGNICVQTTGKLCVRQKFLLNTKQPKSVLLKKRQIATLATDQQNCSRSLLGTSLVHSQIAIRDQAIIINSIRGPYWKIYSSKFHTWSVSLFKDEFVNIARIICQITWYLSKLQKEYKTFI